MNGNKIKGTTWIVGMTEESSNIIISKKVENKKKESIKNIFKTYINMKITVISYRHNFYTFALKSKDDYHVVVNPESQFPNSEG